MSGFTALPDDLSQHEGIARGLTVKGPYSDGSFAVVDCRADGRFISHGFFRSRGLADARLFQMRDERRGRP